MEINDWYCSAIYYFLDINGKTKFGITNDWIRREKMYMREFIDIPIILLKKYDFEHYWQAELVENVMRRRLKKWVIPGTHEWVRKEMPIQGIFDCFIQTKQILTQENGFMEYEPIHKHGKDRYAYYRDIYNMYFINEF